MRPIYDDTVTKEDGTPLRKYELAEVRAPRAATRFALMFVLGNMFLLLKNILFPDDARNFGAATGNAEANKQKNPGTVKADGGPGAEQETREDIAEAPAVEEIEDAEPVRFKRGSSTNIDLIDDERPTARIPGFAYSSNPPLIASNDNPIIFSVSSELSLTNLIGSGNAGSGGGGEERSKPVEERDDEEPKTPPRLNRLPVVAAPIVFDQILGSQAVVLLLSDLLRHVHDPDGDALKIVGLVSSKGQTVEIRPGVFSFTPDPEALGPVTFSYFVSDGQAAVRQTASITVIELDGERITGTASADVLIGTGEDDIIEALGGDDSIVAGAGDDIVYGGEGNDRILGSSGHDVIYGGEGDDIIFAGAGNDVVFGGKGKDTLLGEEGEDTLFGDDDDDIISGGADDDYVDGGLGNDHLQGDGGDDVVFGRDGADVMEGGDGDDLLEAGAGNDHVDAGSGNDTIMATAGFRQIPPADASTASDPAAAETADDGDDTYDGGAGIDTYDISATFASATIDLFSGMAQSDEIRLDRLENIENVIGGSGDDTIIANEQANELAGGAGDDIFVFRTVASAGHGPGSRDRILDFEVGDKIDLDDISREFRDLADAFEDDGIKKFVLIKNTDAFARPGELRFKYENEDGDAVTILEGNIDGDAETEFEIEIIGVRDLSDHDFTWNT